MVQTHAHLAQMGVGEGGHHSHPCSYVSLACMSEMQGAGGVVPRTGCLCPVDVWTTPPFVHKTGAGRESDRGGGGCVPFGHRPTFVTNAA